MSKIVKGHLKEPLNGSLLQKLSKSPYPGNILDLLSDPLIPWFEVTKGPFFRSIVGHLKEFEPNSDGLRPPKSNGLQPSSNGL